jgi:hypothetical protein
MLPRLARRVLSEFGTMYSQLQAVDDALPMATVTGPSLTKFALKKMNEEDLTAKNDALVVNADLQSAIGRRYVPGTMLDTLVMVPAHLIFASIFL